MNVVIMSSWRNDEERQIDDRAAHLLAKSASRWVWVVGDSTDNTYEILKSIASDKDKDITVIHVPTRTHGNTPRRRLIRLSLAKSYGLSNVRDDDDYWIIHESDLVSDENIVERFIGTGLCPVAGWVTLRLNGQRMFYDTWAYRKDGVRFSNELPYHTCYRNYPFEVDSVGSCFMFHASDVRDGLRCESMDVLEISHKLKAKGRHIWVDPSIQIIQPVSLYESNSAP